MSTSSAMPVVQAHWRECLGSRQQDQLVGQSAGNSCPEVCEGGAQAQAGTATGRAATMGDDGPGCDGDVEADQRACRVLMRRLPFPAPPLGVVTPSRTARSPSPYLVIAAELRTAILDGALPAGVTLPTVEQLGARHHVAASTAHRAIAVLAAENLVTVSRGRRAIVTPTSPATSRARFSGSTGGAGWRRASGGQVHNCSLDVEAMRKPWPVWSWVQRMPVSAEVQVMPRTSRMAP